MAAGVVRIPWYATVFRGDVFADAVAGMSPLALRFGASQYAVHRSRDDGYKIDQMLWFDSKDDWYRFWESPELIEFRARWMGKYQIPVVYVWYDEVAHAHQLLRENKHLGKIAILVGAAAEDEGRTADGPRAIRAEVG